MSAPNMPGPVSSGWTVESQTEDTRVTPAGQVARGVTVGFRTGHGVYGSVFVPDDLYTADNVRAMIAVKSAEIDAVSALTHES